MPDRIPDTPENVARAIMQGPPKRDWDFLKPGGAGYRPRGGSTPAKRPSKSVELPE